MGRTSSLRRSEKAESLDFLFEQLIQHIINMAPVERPSAEMLRETAEQQAVVDDAMLQSAKAMVNISDGKSAIELAAEKEREKQAKKAAKKAEKDAKKAERDEEKAFQERLATGTLSKKERKSLEKEMN